MNIDAAIFIVFLGITIVVGLMSSRGTDTIRQYAVGDRSFSTATIVATIVATWISGEFFYSGIFETYSKGLHFIWSDFGNPLCLLFVGWFLAPRMGEFLGKLSIAEAMGDLYGKRVKVITAIASVIKAIGKIGVQIKLAGMIFEYALGLSSTTGVITATIIVTLYSSLGGIRAVTFTDVIQFFTFGVMIPILAWTMFVGIKDFNIVMETLTTNPLFDYKEAFDFSSELPLAQLFVFLYCIAPSFSPEFFQRISIAKNTKQVSSSFMISAFVCCVLLIFMDWIGVLALSIYPSLHPQDVVRQVIFSSSYIGLAGIVLAGIMAMIMSTVDSCINSTAVIVAHDLLKPLKLRLFNNEVIVARVASFLIGMFSLTLSLREGSLLELLIMTASFYMPIVSVSFIMAIFGFRSTEKSVIAGMIGGFIVVLIWKVFNIEVINSVFIGMSVNFVFLMSTHYLFKQPGGWVGIKDQAILEDMRLERRRKFQHFIDSIKSFDFWKACLKNSPRGDGIIAIFGFFVMLTVFSSTNTLQLEYQEKYAYLINILLPIILCSTSLLMSYPLCLQRWKDTGFMGVYWNIVMFFVLICYSFLMVLISNFSEIQLIAFMANIIMLSALVSWRWALSSILVGVSFTTFCYQHFLYMDLPADNVSLRFKIIYLLLLMFSTLIVFLRPKEARQVLSDEKVEHLASRIDSKDEEVREAVALRSEFIRNVSHEYHAPMTGVITLVEALVDGYDEISDAERKQVVKDIYQSAIRLESFDNNINTLAQLSKAGFKLQKAEIDLSALIYDRVKVCRRLYGGNDDGREFILHIEKGIKIEGDSKYLIELFDNLIINAISFCKNGRIIVVLSRDGGEVSFELSDDGIGIPSIELLDIFEPFVVGSRTRSQGGGRGVGLSVCKRVVDVHGGKIWAESHGANGAVFKVQLKGITI